MTTVAVPQNLQALARADEVRLARAQVKRDLQNRRTTIAAVIDEPCVQSMRVAQLLAAQHRWGARTARDLVRRVPCSEFITVRDLTDRQRARILELLDGGS